MRRPLEYPTGRKHCPGCNESLPLDSFGIRLRNDRPTKHRPRSRCKVCEATQSVEYTSGQAANDPNWWRRRRLVKYNITLEQFDAMLDEQGGGCAICGATEAGGRGDFHVDHDHRCCPGWRSCGKCVRGLLCSGCNQGIGSLGDDSKRLMSAAKYLERYELGPLTVELTL